MSELARLLTESVEGLLERHADAAPDELKAALWESGLPLALASEESGGAGCLPSEAAVLPRAWGRAAADLPLAEILLAEWLNAEAGGPLDSGTLVVAPPAAHRLTKADAGWRLSGPSVDLPAFPGLTHLLLLADSGGDTRLVAVRLDDAETTRGLAGEPRLRLTCDSLSLGDDSLLPLPAALSRLRVQALGATLVTAAMVGAMEAILDIAIEHAGERKQFGRPIGRFQAVQHLIADAAGETALAASHLEGALAALDRGDAAIAWTAAKATAAQAASRVAAVGHQVLGAISLTVEHPLHRYSTRLWGWRDAWATQSACEQAVGRAAVTAGSDGLWALIADGM